MENKDIVVNEEKKYSNDAKKSYIILGVLASLICMLSILWSVEYPGTLNFSCDRTQNLCELSYENIFGQKRAKQVSLNDIQKAVLVEKVFKKKSSKSSYRYNSYRYDLNLYYNNNGKLDTLYLFSSQSYDHTPPLKNDYEYKYYCDLTDNINEFLADKSIGKYQTKDYNSSDLKGEYFSGIIFGIMLFILLFVYIIPIIVQLLSIVKLIPVIGPILDKLLIKPMTEFIFKEEAKV
ncbi:unknown [Fusobacterium sp. CAG:439]|nr:unknown [Fusobacterium sp. CAG:439]